MASSNSPREPIISRNLIISVQHLPPPPVIFFFSTLFRSIFVLLPTEKEKKKYYRGDREIKKYKILDATKFPSTSIYLQVIISRIKFPLADKLTKLPVIRE